MNVPHRDFGELAIDSELVHLHHHDDSVVDTRRIEHDIEVTVDNFDDANLKKSLLEIFTDKAIEQ